MNKQTPDFEEGSDDDQPTRDLDVYHGATQPTTTEDEFLRRNNLGLGYYEDTEIWQQLERFSEGMYGLAAFREKLIRKGIRQTKRHLALEGETFYDEQNMEVRTKEGWRDLDEDERRAIKQAQHDEVRSRREWLEMRGEQIWSELDDEERLDALEIVAGIDEEWTPPHLRILLAQHEMSRSKGARALDNLFGRETVSRVISDDEDGGGLLGGGSR